MATFETFPSTDKELRGFVYRDKTDGKPPVPTIVKVSDDREPTGSRKLKVFIKNNPWKLQSCDEIYDDMYLEKVHKYCVVCGTQRVPNDIWEQRFSIKGPKVACDWHSDAAVSDAFWVFFNYDKNCDRLGSVLPNNKDWLRYTVEESLSDIILSADDQPAPVGGVLMKRYKLITNK